MGYDYNDNRLSGTFYRRMKERFTIAVKPDNISDLVYASKIENPKHWKLFSKAKEQQSIKNRK